MMMANTMASLALELDHQHQTDRQQQQERDVENPPPMKLLVEEEGHEMQELSEQSTASAASDNTPVHRSSNSSLFSRRSSMGSIPESIPEDPSENQESEEFHCRDREADDQFQIEPPEVFSQEEDDEEEDVFRQEEEEKDQFDEHHHNGVVVEDRHMHYHHHQEHQQQQHQQDDEMDGSSKSHNSFFAAIRGSRGGSVTRPPPPRDELMQDSSHNSQNSYLASGRTRRGSTASKVARNHMRGGGGEDNPDSYNFMESSFHNSQNSFLAASRSGHQRGGSVTYGGAEEDDLMHSSMHSTGSFIAASVRRASVAVQGGAHAAGNRARNIRASIINMPINGYVTQVGTSVATNVGKGVVQGGATVAQVGTSVAANVGKGVVQGGATVAQVGTSVATNVGKGVVQGGATVAQVGTSVATNVGKGVVQGGAVVGHGVAEGGKKLESGIKSGVRETRRKILGLEDYTYEELKKIETRRREILRRRNLSFFRILTFWDGTVLSALSTDPFIYGLMTLYIAIRVAARTSIPYYVAALAQSDVAIIGGFLTFFLVFYSQETNNRFQHMYRLSMESEERIFDAAALARTTLPRARALRLVRYMNAAHIAGYIGIEETYTFDNFFVNENRAKGMLSKTEVERMIKMNMDKGSSCNRELCTWALHEVQLAEQAKIIGPRLAQFYRDIICKLQNNFGMLYAYDDQPIGFFYVHFVCLLTFLYLPLFTIQMSLNAGTGEEVYWLTDVVNGLIVFLQAVYVIGLRLMADRLAEPYGSDYEDLSVMYYINFAWTMSRRILEAELPGEADLEHEEALVHEAEQSIGYPWEGETEISDSEDSMDMTGASANEFGVTSSFKKRRGSKKDV